MVPFLKTTHISTGFILKHRGVILPPGALYRRNHYSVKYLFKTVRYVTLILQGHMLTRGALRYCLNLNFKTLIYVNVVANDFVFQVSIIPNLAK